MNIKYIGMDVPVKVLRNFAQANSCLRSEKRAPSTPSHPLRKQNKLTRISRQDALGRATASSATKTLVAMCVKILEHCRVSNWQAISWRLATDSPENSK